MPLMASFNFILPLKQSIVNNCYLMLSVAKYNGIVMKIKKHLKIYTVAAFMLFNFSVGILSFSNTVSAQARCPDGSSAPDGDISNCNTQVSPDISQEISDTTVQTDCDAEVVTEDNCKILEYLVRGINFLSAVVGLVAVFSLMWAGYQYITARDNMQSVSAAKNRIAITIFALLMYIFMYAILNFLIPGGLIP